MSEYEYNNLLYKISKRLDKIHVGEQLLVICRGKLPARNEENIATFSLFKELEGKGFLSPDRLNVLKAMLKGVKEWALLEEAEKFEAKRKEYNDLLEQVIQVLDGLNDLERLLSICGRKITEARQSSIFNVRSLFKELESNHWLGIDCLDTLKEILNQTKENNLLKEVEEFEQRQNHELKSERLSPPQRLPLGILIKINARALSFSFSSASPQHRGLCGGEREWPLLAGFLYLCILMVNAPPMQ